MKLIALAIIILVILATIWVAGVTSSFLGRGPEHWELRTEETADSTEFWLVKRKNADFIGRAMRNAVDYDDRYLELENEATEKKHLRNAANRITEGN